MTTGHIRPPAQAHHVRTLADVLHLAQTKVLNTMSPEAARAVAINLVLDTAIAWADDYPSGGPDDDPDAVAMATRDVELLNAVKHLRRVFEVDQ